jgi:hypothetical protein
MAPIAFHKLRSNEAHLALLAYAVLPKARPQYRAAREKALKTGPQEPVSAIMDKVKKEGTARPKYGRAQNLP